MNRAKKVLSFWKKCAPTNQSMFCKPDADVLDLLEKKEILSYLPDLKGKKILDPAAGIGRYTGHFATLASHVTVNDFTSHFVEKNKSTHADFTNIEYHCKDAMDLHFENASFDFIFINWLLNYLEDKEASILAERIMSWLSPGGHLFLREACSVPEIHLTGKYYVHYRHFHFYTRLFENNLNLLKHDNIKLSEQRFADPFQCYWVFQK